MAEELLPCPREPDGKMLAAGRDALEPYVGNLKQPIKDQWELARLVWAAMTEARPSSQPLMGDCSGLLVAAKALRAAQRAYMADRGNEEKGRAVGLAADALDSEIAKADAILASLPAQGGEPVAWRGHNRNDGNPSPRTEVEAIYFDGSIVTDLSDELDWSAVLSWRPLAHPVPEQDGWRPSEPIDGFSHGKEDELHRLVIWTRSAEDRRSFAAWADGLPMFGKIAPLPEQEAV